MAISEQVGELNRSELEDLAIRQYEQLQEFDERLSKVETELEKRPKIRMNGNDVKDFEVGDKEDGTFVPLGHVVSAARNQVSDVEDRVYNIERGKVNVADVIDAGASESELQIQRWRADVKDADHPDDVSGLTANQARSTELWAFFPKLSEASHGKRKLERSDATKIFRNLSDHDLPSDRNTVNRCMRFMARATGPTDDEQNDDHLVTFHPGDEGSQSVLVADQDEWEEFVADLTGVDAPDRDSNEDLLERPRNVTDNHGEATSADDATKDVAEDLDAIRNATAATTPTDDSVTADHGMEDDLPRASEL